MSIVLVQHFLGSFGDLLSELHDLVNTFLKKGSILDSGFYGYKWLTHIVHGCLEGRLKTSLCVYCAKSTSRDQHAFGLRPVNKELIRSDLCG